MTYATGQAQITLAATTSGSPNGPVVPIGTAGTLESITTQLLTNTTTVFATGTLFVGSGTPQATYVVVKLDEGELSYGRDLFWTGSVPVSTNDLIVLQYEASGAAVVNVQWRVLQ